MCGRYTYILNKQKARRTYESALNTDIEPIEDLAPNYNAAPLMDLPIITNNNPQEIRNHEWGFQLKEDNDIVINARRETIHKKPLFQKHLKDHRCLVIASGFYEWSNGQPHYISPMKETPIAFAGLWKPPRRTDIQTDLHGETVQENGSFVIITQPATNDVSHIHNRIPVILTPDEMKKWLSSPSMPKDTPCLKSHRVSNLVNTTENNNPNLIKPVE